MPIYTCQRCLKEFSQKSHYTAHQNKKLACQDNKGKIEEVIETIILNNKLITNNNNNDTINSTMDSVTTTDSVTTSPVEMSIPNISTANYNTIKQYYDDNLNKDKNLVVTTNDEPTPITCVEEMVSKIPESFWKNENVKILDPCCGCGNFPFVIYYKLLKLTLMAYPITNLYQPIS